MIIVVSPDPTLMSVIDTTGRGMHLNLNPRYEPFGWANPLRETR